MKVDMPFNKETKLTIKPPIINMITTVDTGITITQLLCSLYQLKVFSGNKLETLLSEYSLLYKNIIIKSFSVW